MGVGRLQQGLCIANLLDGILEEGAVRLEQRVRVALGHLSCDQWLRIRLRGGCLVGRTHGSGWRRDTQRAKVAQGQLLLFLLVSGDFLRASGCGSGCSKDSCSRKRRHASAGRVRHNLLYAGLHAANLQQQQ